MCVGTKMDLLGCYLLTFFNFIRVGQWHTMTSYSLQLGFCQGDPFSPHLFILAIDVLTKIIHRAEHNGIIQLIPIIPWPNNPIDTLLFAPIDIPWYISDSSVWARIALRIEG